jgi:HAE1 family hydrophobic/amphiphilic exporter-1/multidrug efflux pump
LSTAGGFTFVLQNRGGADTAQLSQVLQGLLTEARKRPEIRFVYSGFDPRIPQIEFAVDRDKVKSLGIQLSDVFFVLQTFLGSYYVNDSTLRRTYRSRPRREARAASPTTSTASTWHRRRDHGTALHAGEQPAAQRSAVFRAVQRLQRGHYQRDECAGLQLGPAIAAESRPRTARGLRLRMERGDLPEKKTGGQTAYPRRSLPFVILVLAARRVGRCRWRSCGDSVAVWRVPVCFSGHSTTMSTLRSG